MNRTVVIEKIRIELLKRGFDDKELKFFLYLDNVEDIQLLKYLNNEDDELTLLESDLCEEINQYHSDSQIFPQ